MACEEKGHRLNSGNTVVRLGDSAEVRRKLLQLAAGCALPGALPSAVSAQSVAGLPVARLLLGAPPGGVGDMMARRLADRLRGHYAQSVLIDNKPGAGGQLAVMAVKNGPDDGSTLLLTPSSPLSLYPSTYRQLPYKPESDLKPVALVAYSSMAFAVGPSVPASVRRLDDFMSLARQRPELASYGSAASGSIPHLLVASVAHSHGTPLNHVAYKGSAPALQDLRAGILPALSGPVGTFLPHLGSGQIRLLAVSGDKRSTFVPDVPTYRESGYAIGAREWYGFFAPASTRNEQVQFASKALLTAMKHTSMAETLALFGLEPGSGGPTELAAQLKADRAEWTAQILKIGFSAET